MKYYALIKDIIIGLGIIIAIFGYMKMKSDLNAANGALITAQQSMEELKLEMGKIQAQTTIVESNSYEWKEALEKLKEENDAIYAQIRKNNEDISNIGVISSTTNIVTNTDEVSDDVINVVDTDIADDNNEVEISYKEYFKNIAIPGTDSAGNEADLNIAWAKFKDKDKLWDTGTYAISYKMEIIQSETESGITNTYVNSWMEDVNGITKPLDVTAQFKQVKLKDEKFFWWAPHVSLNAGANSDGRAGGGISYSISGYGKTKNDLSWRFFDVGISTDGDGVWLKFAPASYNIGNILPGISNTFISPYIGGAEDGFMAGIALSVPF